MLHCDGSDSHATPSLVMAGLVLVSIGYDEGLRKGHFLDVTRGGRYVGKLKVRNTEPDRAVAEILENYSEGIFQEGDRVDTSIE